MPKHDSITRGLELVFEGIEELRDLPPLAVPVDWQEVRLKTGPALQATLRVYP